LDVEIYALKGKVRVVSVVCLVKESIDQIQSFSKKKNIQGKKK